MSEISFSDNYHDLSNEYGVNAGFQFEYYCEVCRDVWRSEFEAYHSAQASGWLDKAAGIFGGVFHQASNAVEGLAQSGWRSARDMAFKKSLESAKHHFHRCAKCHQYVCAKCWNTSSGLCVNCAPLAQVEIESSRAHGIASGAGEKAMDFGRQRGAQMDVTAEKQLMCPECGAPTKGAKFCPECGSKLAIKSQCPGCGSEIPPSVKFCPECGHPLKR